MTYYFQIERSKHCCAVYWLTNLEQVKPSDEYVAAILEKAKANAMPKGHLPLIIEFSDAVYDEPTGTTEPQKGEALFQKLLNLGYRCDKFRLGVNTKSHNRVTLYHWHTKEKNNKISILRDITYGDKKAGTRISGTASGTGVTAGRRAQRGGVF